MKNEKFSKFVLFLNQKTNYTFGTRILKHSSDQSHHLIYPYKNESVIYKLNEHEKSLRVGEI